MTRTGRKWMTAVVSVLMVTGTTFVALAAAPLPAGAAVITLPDMKINVPVDRISIGVNGTTGDRQLQFTHQTWDAGTGPFAILPTVNSHTGVSSFVQQIYRSSSPGVWVLDHSVPLAVAGVFQAPSDYHFPLTRFTLNKLNGSTIGAVVEVSPKVDYCITGDTYIGGVPNTPNVTSPPQSDCGNPNALLGWSVGWGDQYDQTDNGQPIDLSGVPDGTYVLRATVDPQHLFQEATATNNVTDTVLTITGSSVVVGAQSFPHVVPPTVSMTSPTAGATVKGTVTLTASAQATLPATVTSVRYLLDGEPLGAPITNAPYTYQWATNLSPGPHTLSAQVTDSNGSVGTAPVRSVTVTRSTTGLAIDTATVRTGHGNVTTAPFSTTVTGDTLLAFVGADGPSSSPQRVTVSGAGLTWRLVRRSNGQAGDAEIWSATTSKTLHSVTIMSKESSSGFAQQLEVVALSGAAGLGATAVGAAASGAPHVSLTSIAKGSLVLGVGSDWDHAVGRAVNSGQSLLSQWVDDGDGDTFWVQATSAPTTSVGQKLTLGASAPTNDRWDMVGVEVRPKVTPKLAVALTNPVRTEALFGSVLIATAINDAVNVRTVRYAIDGRSLRVTVPRRGDAPRWNSRTVANGNHTLSVTVTDVLGRRVTRSVAVDVANPKPTMTCFVLSASNETTGGATTVAAPLHVSSPGEQLVAFVRAASRATAGSRVSSPGLTWRLVRRASGPAGDVAVWTTRAPANVVVARVTSQVARGRQSLEVMAIESTTGVAAVVSSTSGRHGHSSITTSRPVALLFAVGIQTKWSGSVPAGWTSLAVSGNAFGTSSWVRYTSQPVLRAGTTVRTTSLRPSTGAWTNIVVELPGSDS